MRSPRFKELLGEDSDLVVANLALWQGQICQEQFDAAMEARSREGGSLVSIFRQRGWLTEEQILALEEGDLGSGRDRTPEEVQPHLGDPSRCVAEYVLATCLGRGGAGEVWKAWDRGLSRWVAIKRPALDADDPVCRERFLREAHAAARLQHPNIVPVYRVAEEGGRFYIVMHLVEGETLEGKRMPVREALGVALQVASAVHHAHERGVVHRDLKPGNIMRDRNGQVWLMDFGLAYVLEATARLTATGTVFGTPHYMSPEQARGEPRGREATTDIYSLGATLYELATGRPPFVGASAPEIMRRVIDEPPLPPTRLDGRISRDVETIILKALEKDPGRRYPTAAALQQDIERVLRNEPILARRASWTYRARRGLRRHRLIFALSAALLAALAATGLGWGAGEREFQRLLVDAAAAESRGDWSRAIELYDRLWGFRPEDPALLEKKSHAVRAAGEARFAEARGRLQGLRLRSRRAGWKFSEEERALTARIEAETFDWMKVRGESAEGWWVAGRARELAGDRTGALTAFSSALLRGPDHPASLQSKGRMLFENARIERAVASEAKSAEPIFRRKLGEASQLLTRAASGGLDEFEADLARALALAAGRDQTNREDYCEKMLEKWSGKPYREEFHLVRALAGEDVDLDDLLKTWPGFYEACLWVGVYNVSEEDWDEAINCLNRALEIHPDLVEARALRGIARMEEDGRGAEKDLSRALEANPRLKWAWRNRGALRARAERSAEAAADFGRVVDLDPGDAAAWCDRGGARLKMGEIDGAKEDFTTAHDIETSPASALGLAACSLERGELKAAEHWISAALQIAPGDPRALSARGDLWKTKSDKCVPGSRDAVECLRSSAVDYQAALKTGSFSAAERRSIEDRLAKAVRGFHRWTEAHLGAEMRRPTPDEAQRLSLAPSRFLIVESVEPGGTAARAGVSPGDVLLRIGKSEIWGKDQAQDVLDALRWAGRTKIRLKRGADGKEEDVELLPAARLRRAEASRLEWQFAGLEYMDDALDRARIEKKKVLVGLSGSEG
jgi:tetratricopeptide (TPR) repeat protein